MVDTIEELTDLSRKLNEKSNTLSSLISSINKRLAKLNIGVEVWLDSVPLVVGETKETQNYGKQPVSYRVATVFGYCRVDDEWQLAIREVTLNYIDEDSEEPRHPRGEMALLKANRILRAQAMGHVPVLLNAIKAKATELLATIEGAEKAAEALSEPF